MGCNHFYNQESSTSPYMMKSAYYGHLGTYPDYQGILISQVSLYYKASFRVLTKYVNYAGVLILECSHKVGRQRSHCTCLFWTLDDTNIIDIHKCALLKSKQWTGKQDILFCFTPSFKLCSVVCSFITLWVFTVCEGHCSRNKLHTLLHSLTIFPASLIVCTYSGWQWELKFNEIGKMYVCISTSQ